MVDDPGARLRALRLRRGFSQEGLADEAGLSVSTVRKIEQGGSARIETLRTLARALDTETSSLFGARSPGPVTDATEDEKLNLLPLRQVLTPAVGLVGVSRSPVGGSAQESQSRLRDALSNAIRVYQSDDFGAVAAMLPVMIEESHGLVDGAENEGDRREAARLRAEIFQVAGWFLTQVRQYDLAYAAIRDAMRDALDSGDRLTAAAGAISQSWLFVRQGRFDDAERLARETASRVEPRLSVASDAELSAWGWLLLRGSAAAVRNNRVDASDDFLSLAEVAASRITGSGITGRHHQYFTTFNPNVVRMKRAEALIIADDPRGVLRIAEDVRDGAGKRRRSDNYSRHLLDVAAAHAALRDFGDAVGVLTLLLRTAPEWLRHQRKGKDVLSTVLLSRKRRLSSELRELADFMQVQ
ncbi:helix-turn-helix transcriptional regulator [Frankia sp. KB5]|uniref:helix-turn-helix domain-containing protein n=1 Tax=Frankia sp. KB5 TaxID=683318 RepID=UPI000A0F4326|nr:helix-turn-helix transcriptional regulator [Frankia sp. KB5]ORT50599.1 transcriptional regulator [Frankia sp. KB5]